MTTHGVDLSLHFQKVDAILVSSSVHIGYLSGYTNFSREEREAFILITLQKNYLFTDARYSEAVASLNGFELLEISSGVSLSDHLKNLVKKHQLKSLGIEADNLTVAEFKKLRNIFTKIEALKLDDLRGIKSAEEIEKIAVACAIGDKVFKKILKTIKPGITEKQLAAEMELMMRKQMGVPSFETIAAFGAHSSVPHHQTGSTQLKGGGEFVLLDFGVKIDHYCSDMTRTIFMGKASAEQKKMYQTVLEAQKKAAEFLDTQIKKGVAVIGKEVDQVAREYILAQGFPSIPHSLGHGIGLQVHEYPRLSPRSDDVLVEGMVFSIEPGIYIPGLGGVRIEDLYAIEKTGLKQLTKANKDLLEI